MDETVQDNTCFTSSHSSSRCCHERNDELGAVHPAILVAIGLLLRAELFPHPPAEVKDEPCERCHVEHVEEPPGSGRGRRTLVDWKPFGGKKNFDHGLAGWPLEGKHRYQRCEKCHDATYPKTKLPSFLGLRKECTTCHDGTEKEPGRGGPNPHRFTDASLTQCTTCHDFAGWSVPNLGVTRFDHDQTDYPIEGFHVDRRCTGCHEDLASFEVEEDF